MSFLSSNKSKAEKPKKEKKAKAPKEPKPKKEKKSKRKKDEDLSAGEEPSDAGDLSEPQPPAPRVISPKRLDVYALILLLSWLLLVAACVLTYLDIASYGT